MDSTSQEINRRMAEEEIANPPQTGVLTRAKDDQKKGRTQIGPRPEEHPAGMAAKAGAYDEPQPEGTVPVGEPGTGDATEAKAAADAEAAAQAAPPEDGGAKGGEAAGAPAPSAPPAKSAPKAEWITYVTEVRGVPQDEAAGYTKDELIEKYGN
jgi:hypothetical protein